MRVKNADTDLTVANINKSYSHNTAIIARYFHLSIQIRCLCTTLSMIQEYFEQAGLTPNDSENEWIRGCPLFQSLTHMYTILDMDVRTN